jgi:hypothetical protein
MNESIARWLGFCGLLPFIGLTLLVLTDYLGWGPVAGDALRVYAALILSFLGGVSWGIALRGQQESLYSLSMIPFFGAWAALLAAGVFSYGLLMAAFVAAHVIDHHARARQLLPGWFFTLRRQLTIGVLICLIAVVMSL